MNLKSSTILGIISLFLMSFAFIEGVFPSLDLKSLDGKTVSTDEFVKDGKVTVISFWATWCSPCKRELDAIADLYPDWQEEYDVELVAVTIDNSRQLTKVPGIVSSKNWDYTVLADSKQKLQRALNFETIPQTFVLDKEGNIVYSHNGYNPGDEDDLEDVIAKYAK
jgi:peroxiredoxin